VVYYVVDACNVTTYVIVSRFFPPKYRKNTEFVITSQLYYGFSLSVGRVCPSPVPDARYAGLVQASIYLQSKFISKIWLPEDAFIR